MGYDDPTTWPLQVTIADQAGIDVRRLLAVIRDHYVSVNGKPVDVIQGGAGKDWPASIYRIRDRKEVVA